jgi:phosphate transport system protein
MKRHFEGDLGLIREKLILMASLAVSNIELSIKTLVERDDKFVPEIYTQEDKINSMHIEIDNNCEESIALHQPMAKDLRLLVSALKISQELERIGDQAANITQSALELIHQPALKPLIDIPRMAEMVQNMVKDALESFIKEDSRLAREVLVRDDRIDDYKDQIFRELLTFMLQDVTCIPRALQLILISRHLERIADHSTNIAEDVVYLVEGKDIRHHLESKTERKTEG